MKKKIKVTHIDINAKPIKFPADVSYLDVDEGKTPADFVKKWAVEKKQCIVSFEVLTPFGK